MTELVLVGAGHAHIEVLRRFGHSKPPGVRLTLVTRARHTPYSGMLPGLVAGRYAFADAHTDVAALAAFAGARLVLATATGLDMPARRLLCDAGAVLFDAISLNIGAHPTTHGITGAAEHAIPVKPIDGFLARFETVLARAQAGLARHVVVVGGGAGGVELMLAVAHRLRAAAPCMRFTLVTASAEILPGFPPAFARRLRAALAAGGVDVRTGQRVHAVTAAGLVLAGGAALPADAVLWATEAAAPPWLATTGLATDPRGFLRVDAHLQAAPGVFAAGDMVAFGPAPIARSGVQAVRAGLVLAANVRAAAAGGWLAPFRPRPTALAIVSTADGRAVAARGRLVVSGRSVWWLKDWIDRRFMARYRAPFPGGG